MKLTTSERMELQRQASVRNGRADAARHARLILLLGDGLIRHDRYDVWAFCRRAFPDRSPSGASKGRERGSANESFELSGEEQIPFCVILKDLLQGIVANVFGGDRAIHAYIPKFVQNKRFFRHGAVGPSHSTTIILGHTSGGVAARDFRNAQERYRRPQDIMIGGSTTTIFT